jgi:hypothetical protein
MIGGKASVTVNPLLKTAEGQEDFEWAKQFCAISRNQISTELPHIRMLSPSIIHAALTTGHT